MTKRTRWMFVAVVVVVLAGGAVTRAQAPATTTVASGLTDPRAIAFAPGGDLYVAEAWTAPGTLTTLNCYQSVIGPFTGGFTSRLVRVSRRNGAATVVADGFPSSSAAVGDNFGLAGIVFAGPHVAVLSGGAGCSKGHPEAVNAVIALGDRGTRRSIADLSAWILANPGQKGVEQFNGPDYEPDGVWFALTEHHGDLLALEANHGLLVEIGPRHAASTKHRPRPVRLVRDLYKAFGDHTYTSLASDRGQLYVGTYGRFDNGFAGAIYRVGSHRSDGPVATGLTSVLGIAFDRRHRLYAIQAPIFDGGGAGLGSLVRIERDGTHTTLLQGLASPGSLTLGPHGALYLAQCSFHCAPGAGWITRVDLGR